jgi:hypothetical protein
MAFNSEIANQVRLHATHLGEQPGLPVRGQQRPRLDQVIGHGTRPKTTCPVTWNAAATKTDNAAPQAVTMRGGEYFFIPSIAFLKAL